MRPGRRLGIDVGDVRIGVAASDPEGLIASPLETVPAKGDPIARILAIAGEYEPIECVIGLPIGLSGQEGAAAAKARAFAGRLIAALPGVSIRLVDERMSTVTAASQLRASGRNAKKSRSVIDQAAATVILQTALDAERTRGTAPGELIEGTT